MSIRERFQAETDGIVSWRDGTACICGDLWIEAGLNSGKGSGSRVAAQRHYASDVAKGAGYVIGHFA